MARGGGEPPSPFASGVEPLRIGVVAPPFYSVPPPGYGGIERVCHALTNGLADRGHDVTLIGVGARGVTCRFFATRSHPHPEGTEQDVDVEVVHAARAAGLLAALDLDIVHDHSRAGPLTAGGRQAATVMTVHGPVTPGTDQRDFYEALSAHVSLVAISPAQRRDAPDLPWRATVPNGICVEDFVFRAAKDDFVLYLGRMNAQKGVHIAIDAARQANRPMIIAGDWTVPSEREYAEREVRPRLSADATWVGEVKGTERTDLLSRARCLLLPTLGPEPFGLVVVEAMASGTPVVGLRRGSLPDLVVDGETGVLCDQVEDLPAAIEAAGVLSSARCRAHVQQHFSAERMVRGYEQVYASLVRRG
jgi:glycosyltransferase involved in cell wall biosynthesis